MPEVYVVQLSRPLFSERTVPEIEVNGKTVGLPPVLDLQPGDRIIIERIKPKESL